MGDNYAGYRALRSYLWHQGFDTRFYSLGFILAADELKVTRLETAKNSFFFDVRKNIKDERGRSVDTVVAIARFLFKDEPQSEVFRVRFVLNYDVCTEEGEHHTCIHPLNSDYKYLRRFFTTHSWKLSPGPITQYEKDFELVQDFMDEFSPFVNDVLVAQLKVNIPNVTYPPQ